MWIVVEVGGGGCFLWLISILPQMLTATPSLHQPPVSSNETLNIGEMRTRQAKQRKAMDFKMTYHCRRL